MSIQFPSDNGSAPRGKKGGAGILFLLIFVGVAFFVIRGTGSRTAPEENGYSSQRDLPDSDYPEARLPELDQANSPTSNGDWSTEPVTAQRNSSTNNKQPNKESRNGDWSVEQVTAQPTSNGKRPDFKNDARLQLKHSGNAKNPQPSKTTNGDWTQEID